MVEVFGLMVCVKVIILCYWIDCVVYEDIVCIDIEGMCVQDFEYFFGWFGVLVCQVVGMFGGNDVYGVMFDVV